MPRPKPDITPEKLVLFEQMFLAGEDRHEIANAVNLYHDRVKVMMTEMPEVKKMERHRNLVARRGKGHYARHSSVSEPSAQAWEDRDRRFCAPRSLTAEFFGDPRPGQSALDKRLEAVG